MYHFEEQGKLGILPNMMFIFLGPHMNTGRAHDLLTQMLTWAMEIFLINVTYPLSVLKTPIYDTPYCRDYFNHFYDA